jgi:hypothetical protein
MAEAGHRFYQEDEAEQILRMAASFTPLTGAVSRERLLQTASELGIAPEAVALAEARFAEQKAIAAELAEFDSHQRREFFSFFTTFLVINVSVLALNIFTGAKYMWMFWLTCPMLIGLGFDAVETYVKTSQSYQDAFAKWKAVKVRREADEEVIPQPTKDAAHVIDRYVHRRLDRGRTVCKRDAIRYLQATTELDSIDAKEAVDRYITKNPGLLD